MKKDNLIFIHKLLKAIADSIITVFIPLFILKQTGDVQLSIAYLIVHSLLVMGYLFLFKKFIEKHGVLAIILHFIPIIVTEGILSFTENITISTVLICAAVMAFSQAFYAVPLNIIFAFGDKKTNVGKFQIATNIGKLIFILISGYILSSSLKNSFLILSIASSVFYLACVIPLLFIYKELIKRYQEAHEQKHSVKIPVKKEFLIFHTAFGIFQPVMDHLLPLYLYLNHLSFSAVTIVIALIEFVKILSNYVSQKLVSRKKEVFCVTFGALIFVASVLCMIFIRNSLVLYIVSCTCSVSMPFTFVAMFRKYCQYLRETGNVFDGLWVRDLNIFSFRPMLYLIAFLPAGLTGSFVFGIFSIPILYWMERRLLK